jgi:hypothetical protein
MRKSIFILTFMILLKISSGQDATKRFEFGSTLATVDMYHLHYLPPTAEFVNGLFFRCTRKRFGLRLHLSYSDKTTSYASTSVASPYFGGSSRNEKDLKVGIGGQYAILNSKEWLYSFLDVAYRNVFSNGFYFGGVSETFSSTSNGFDCFAGIGFKIKALKYFYLSPEIGYYSSTHFVKRTTTLADTYNLSTGQLVSNKNSYTFTDINPVLKLHLTVKF